MLPPGSTSLASLCWALEVGCCSTKVFSALISKSCAFSRVHFETFEDATIFRGTGRCLAVRLQREIRVAVLGSICGQVLSGYNSFGKCNRLNAGLNVIVIFVSRIREMLTFGSRISHFGLISDKFPLSYPAHLFIAENNVYI